MWTWFLLGFLCALAVALVACYFKFAALHKQVLKIQNKLDMQLRKRRNLIPPLALTAAGLPELGASFSYSLQQLPDQALRAGSLAKQAAVEIDLSKALHELFAAAAKHPEFQKDAYFQRLYQDLIRTENRIQYTKRRYNSAVRDYNTLTGVVPLNVLAGLLDFKPFEYFDFEKSL